MGIRASGVRSQQQPKSPGSAYGQKSPLMSRSPGLGRSMGKKEGSATRGGAMRSTSSNQLVSERSTISGRSKMKNQPKVAEPITADQIRSEMVTAFGKIRLDIYSDILRIKKPQKIAFEAAQLLCKVVNSFRGGSQKTNHDLLFQEWTQVQNFVHKKPNVIKFH